jgi:hypothetical protein
MSLPVNLTIQLTGLLKPVNYGKKSVVDNIGPSYQVRSGTLFYFLPSEKNLETAIPDLQTAKET